MNDRNRADDRRADLSRGDGETPPTPARRLQWRMGLVSAAVWVLLWADLSLANLLSGFVLGLLITLVFPLPPIAFAGRFRPWEHTKLVARLFVDLVRSSFVVAAQAFRFGHTMTNAVVKVQLRTRSDLYLTLTSEVVTLVPGSLVMEARRQESVLYLHVMDVRSRADVAGARRMVLEAEDRVVRSFGSAAEVAALAAAEAAAEAAGTEVRP
jgi:multicomponent Na+:H+ antiporter subunit E